MMLTLTVLFEAPFWVGVFERSDGTRLEAGKVTFGAQPKDCEVFAFLLDRLHTVSFSPAVNGKETAACANPKRMRRQIRQALIQKGPGTGAQQALALQQALKKTQRKAVSRQQRDDRKQRQFLLRQEKRKIKHKGK